MITSELSIWAPEREEETTFILPFRAQKKENLASGRQILPYRHEIEWLE